MPQLGSDIFGGTWVRYSAYEIRGGCVRPAVGAVAQVYDPWKEYRDQRDLGRAPPYRALLDLAPLVRRGARLDLRPEAEPAVIDFCSRYGLLGVLPHRASLVRLAPRWSAPPLPPTDLDEALAALGLQRDQLTLQMEFNGRAAFVALEEGPGIVFPLHHDPSLPVPIAREYQRTPLGWVRLVREFEIPAGTKPSGVGAPVDLQAFPDAAKPYVLVQRRWKIGFVREDLDWNWVLFFPDVGVGDWQTYDYPCPLSDDFWAQYGEPRDEFASAVDAFAKAVDGLLSPHSSGAQFPDTDPRSPVYGIHSLLEPLSPSLMPVSGGSSRQFYWETPSLLAAFALMAANDATLGMLRRCQSCGEIFSPADDRLSYCSERCQNRQRKREQRLHQKADELRRRGSSIPQIARQLGREEAEISEWLARTDTISRARALHGSGVDVAEIAKLLGVSDAQIGEWVKPRSSR